MSLPFSAPKFYKFLLPKFSIIFLCKTLHYNTMYTQKSILILHVGLVEFYNLNTPGSEPEGWLPLWDSIDHPRATVTLTLDSTGGLGASCASSGGNPCAHSLLRSLALNLGSSSLVSAVADRSFSQLCYFILWFHFVLKREFLFMCISFWENFCSCALVSISLCGFTLFWRENFCSCALVSVGRELEISWKLFRIKSGSKGRRSAG